jgi:hypothetical protein
LDSITPGLSGTKPESPGLQQRDGFGASEGRTRMGGCGGFPERTQVTVAKLRMLLVLLAGIAGNTVARAQTPAALIYDAGVGTIRFAAGDLKAALQQNGYSVSELPLGDPSGATQSVRIILTTSDVSVPDKPTISGLINQGYAIQRVADGAATNWWVIGYDAPGAMYGGLELAEAVKLADGLAGVTNRQTNPYLANRGIKLNIPLDARTPTYTEKTSPARMTSYHSNVTEMWSMDFHLDPTTNSAQFFRVKQ